MALRRVRLVRGQIHVAKGERIFSSVRSEWDGGGRVEVSDRLLSPNSERDSKREKQTTLRKQSRTHGHAIQRIRVLTPTGDGESRHFRARLN